MTDGEIVGTLTIREAAALGTDPRRDHLKRWVETFGVPLLELHLGPFVTYQKDTRDQGELSNRVRRRGSRDLSRDPARVQWETKRVSVSLRKLPRHTE